MTTDAKLIDAIARRLAPLAWTALGLRDSLAQENRRTASLRHARAALSAAEEAGFAIVPKEPAPNQVSAGQKAVQEWWSLEHAAMLADYPVIMVYRAMLAASETGEGDG